MADENLFVEGDVNFTPVRKGWYALLDTDTMDLLNRDTDVFMHQSLSTPCLHVLSSCEGSYITDINGKKYLDFHGNSVHHVGYRNKYVTDRIKQQLDVLPFSPRRYTNEVAVAYAEKLVSYFPDQLNRVLFAPGGTAAVSMALKLARIVTGRQRVISFADSFHGASLDAIAAGGEYQFKKYMGIFPDTINISNPGTDDITAADELEDVLKKEPGIGAFIAETIRNTDVQIPSKTYWRRVREICTRYNVLLILDEIPIAFGKTGKMFAFEHYDIIPDIVCLGKSMGAGVIPMAGIVTKDEYNTAAEISLGHFTHEKSPLGCAAGLAMLEFMEQEQLLNKVKEDEVFVRYELEKMKEQFSFISDVRGTGLLWAIELKNRPFVYEETAGIAEKVLYECLKNGLSFKISQGNVLQLSPPLTISRNELKDAFQILHRTFSSI
ncbi:MAG: aspartate aminotransferase family protein [Lacibacter sp.]